MICTPYSPGSGLSRTRSGPLPHSRSTTSQFVNCPNTPGGDLPQLQRCTVSRATTRGPGPRRRWSWWWRNRERLSTIANQLSELLQPLCWRRHHMGARGHALRGCGLGGHRRAGRWSGTAASKAAPCRGASKGSLGTGGGLHYPRRGISGPLGFASLVPGGTTHCSATSSVLRWLASTACSRWS